MSATNLIMFLTLLIMIQGVALMAMDRMLDKEKDRRRALEEELERRKVTSDAQSD